MIKLEVVWWSVDRTIIPVSLSDSLPLDDSSLNSCRIRSSSRFVSGRSAVVLDPGSEQGEVGVSDTVILLLDLASSVGRPLIAIGVCCLRAYLVVRLLIGVTGAAGIPGTKWPIITTIRTAV